MPKINRPTVPDLDKAARTETRTQRPSITCLQYVCLRLLGPSLPDKYQLHYGESYFDLCPFCGSDGKFHTMPHREGQKDRFKCWVCNALGDGYDLFCYVLKDRSIAKGARWSMYQQLEVEYQRWLETGAIEGVGADRDYLGGRNLHHIDEQDGTNQPYIGATHRQPTPTQDFFSRGGRGQLQRPVCRCCNHLCDVEVVRGRVKGLPPGQIDTLVQALRIAKEQRLCLVQLAVAANALRLQEQTYRELYPARYARMEEIGRQVRREMEAAGEDLTDRWRVKQILRERINAFLEGNHRI